MIIGAVLGSACDVQIGDSDGDDRGLVRVPPDAREYCALVESYYEEVGEWIDSVSRQLGPDVSDESFDQRFVGFVREHQDLYEQMAAAAPDEIADAARAQQEIWAEVAEQGSLDPLQTEASEAAEDETVEYEADVCGVIVP